MNFIPLLINPMKGTSSFSRKMGDMIAVVGKRIAGLKGGAFAHNFISLHHSFGSILIEQNPLSSQQSNLAFGQIGNSDKINKGMQVEPIHG